MSKATPLQKEEIIRLEADIQILQDRFARLRRALDEGTIFPPFKQWSAAHMALDNACVGINAVKRIVVNMEEKQ